MDGQENQRGAGARATSLLRDEHRQILEVVDVLDRLTDDMLTDRGPDLDSFARCVAFFRLFADACHHGKEEDLLFPELVARGFSTSQGPVAVMLDEHRRGRAFVAEMGAALDEIEAGEGDEAVDRLLGAAQGYSDLIRAHIGKEDGVLFEMADALVLGPPCRRLCDAYDVVECGRFEGRTKQELEEIARTLRLRYPPA